MSVNDPMVSRPAMRRSRTGALAALAMAVATLVSACSTPAPSTFDLSAPSNVKPARGGGAQLVVASPSALQVIDSDRIMIRGRNGEVSYLPGAQWADRIPSLVQTRLLQTFENAKRIGSVGRPDDKIVADATLVTEIRSFEIDTSAGATAVVEISAKLVVESTGRIRAAQLFSARSPASGVNGQQASAALDQALQTVLREIVAWASPKV
jgi:cholesterol transport system auxiliary component